MKVEKTEQEVGYVPLSSALMMEVPLKLWQTSTRLHGAISQKTAIFILADVRHSNPTKLTMVGEEFQNMHSS
jgi:hypothetical protein